MAMAVASRRTSLKMTSEEKNQSSGEESSGNAHADLRTFGRYVIEKKIGEGGMGAVYRAVDSNLKRTVALKILPREKAKNEILVKRFEAEAQAAAQLRHKNIVCVYDSGELDGFLYIAMEFVDGIDVQDLVMRKGGLSVKRSLDIIKQVARALEHAHEQTIVHRDIKPANLLIDRDGNVKLADMGLARSIAETEEAGITRAGTTVGTVDYMSPEQARDSKSADCRSDMYALAATWYQMLVGKPVFPDGDLLNKITAHATTAPPDPRDIRPNIPESVVQIMHKMLEKKPAKRYQTPTELIHDLEHGFSETADSGKAAADGGEKLLSLDILAGLAEEDTAADEEIRGRAPKTSSRSRRAKGSDTYDVVADLEMPETTVLPVRKAKSSGEVAVAPAKSKSTRKKPRKSVSKSSTSVPKRSAASTDTIAESSDTSSAIPSRREVMLARNVRHRRDVESRKQMMALVGGGVAVLIVGYLVYSSMFGASAPEAPSPTGASPAGPPAVTAPVGNSAPDAGRPAAPSRQPPRRVE
ncbi:MAG: serine/threonine protein kinase [Planctomycetaceae bacterium]|jgi:serine/threonine protein kinase